MWLVGEGIPHEVQYRVIHRSNSESPDNEESLSEAATTTVPRAPAPALVFVAITPTPPTVTLTPSILLVIEERLAHVEQGQVRITICSTITGAFGTPGPSIHYGA